MMTTATYEVRLGTKKVSIGLGDLVIGVCGDGEVNNVQIRCPYCGNNGTFAPIRPQAWAQNIDSYTINLTASLRCCPNQKCRRPVFTIGQGGSAWFVIPSETLDFDPNGVPELVRSALEEAISCHSAGCYRAAALMVRRTLEEICEERGAQGKNLKDRIEALTALITVPKALLAAMDQLRLLGNDAAHIEAKTYDKVGKDEVEAGIALAKEFVKSTYQYEELLAKLTGLARKLQI